MSDERQTGSKAPIAMAVILGAFAIAGGFRFYQNQLPPRAEMVIQTGNDPTSLAPPNSSNLPSSKGETPPTNSVVTPNSPPKPVEVVIHVAGSVNKPGVVHLKENARNEDAIKAAGGAKSEANLAGVNLAAPAVDGSQLYVPNKSEHPEGGASSELSMHSSSKSGKKPHGGSPTSPKAAASGGKGNKLTSPSEGKVDINKASAEELQKLPGVGPAMAEKIIQHRKENGPFTNIDQLTEVSGIGPKKFEKMKPYVKLNGGSSNQKSK